MASTAQRSASLELGARLAELLRTAQIRIPPYPAVASSIDRLSRDPKATIADVTKAVATDATLAAAVLRHTSTAALKSAGPSTLEGAIKKLGLEELTRVVIAATLGSVASARGPLAVLRRDQWRRSLLAAMFCRELAPRRGVAADQAFLAGLLHDFGAIIVLAALESLSTSSLPVLPESAWRRLVEDHHIDHGMYVVSRWQLPEPIAEVIAHHHTPQSCMRVYRPLVQLVAIVDQIIDILDGGSGGGIAALVGIPGLEHDERFRIGALMPKVSAQMAQFEAPAERESAAPIAEPDPAAADGWPVDFAIESRNQTLYRACTLTPTGFTFRGAVMLQPAWLAELTLHCPPDKISVLAHVKTCVAIPGGYLVSAQPYGLAGDEDAKWRSLIERTQRAGARP